jgi:hypothetical protein
MDALFRLATSDAMQNRAALDPETTRIYSEMVKRGAEGEGYVAGQLIAELIYTLAKQAGKHAPDSLETMLQFLKDELRSFDTPQATKGR